MKFPEFLTELSMLDLVKLQHDLRQYPEDKEYLAEVLREIASRKGAYVRPKDTRVQSL